MRYGVLQDHLTTLEYDLLTTLSSEPLLRDTNKARAHASRMTDDDLRAQLSAGVIRRVYTAPSTLIKVFKIDESNGKFSRLLGDGRPFDERTAKVPAPRLPSMAAIENFVREQAWASIRDFAGWFYQLPIKPSLSKHLGFRVRGLAGVEYYAFRVAISGISRSATMAQVVTGGIHTMARVSDDSLAIYDDVIIGGHDRLEASLRTVAFHSACAEWKDRLVAYHDNTTAEARHRRWASPHVGENALLHQLHLRLVAAGLPPMHTVLVGTNDQLADAGTRGDPLFFD